MKRVERLTAVVAFFVVVILVIGTSTISLYYFSEKRQENVTIQSRLQELVVNLQTASVVIAEIENEINETQKLVDDLEEKRELYEQLVSTDREQVEAIALLLTQEQNKENNRTFWINVVINIVTGLITAIFGTYAEYKVGFFRKWLGVKHP